MQLLGPAKTFASRVGRQLGLAHGEPSIGITQLPNEDADFAEIWKSCQPYTMTSFARGLALFRSVRYIVENSLSGDFVECGVWRGGSAMIAMHTLMKLGASGRRIILFDTFGGMTEPGQFDVDPSGVSAETLMNADGKRPDGVWCIASLDEVRKNIATVGYPLELVSMISGDIRETLPKYQPQRLALLRLDTDFYDSTKIELDTLYQHLCEHGVLIVDDYGHWQGARKAVDEYMGALRAAGTIPPMLQIIDYTGRIAIK